MSIANFSELKTAVANWLHRTDLTTVIPDFVANAEARLNRVLALSAMEVEVPLTCTVNSQYIALPTDAQNVIALWVNQYIPRDKITYLQPQDLPYNAISGYPNYWTVDNQNIKLDRPANVAYAMTFRYYQKLDLSDATPTNWLLTNYPDLYLYASLMESAPFLQDEKMMAIWQSKYSDVLEEAQKNDHANKAMAILVTDMSPTWRKRFDINRGY